MTKKTRPADKLTKRQELFVEELFLCNLNATEAARRVGYANPNKHGPRMMVNDGIKKRVAKRMKEIAMKADECIMRFAEQARANPTDFVQEEPKEMTRGLGMNQETYYIESGSINWDELKRRGHLVNKISFNAYGPVLEMADQQKALEDIARILGLFKDKTAIELPNGPLVEQVIVYIPDNGRDKKNDTDRPTPAG